MNVAELSLKSLEVGEHVSVIFEGKEFTNVQMNRDANRLGNALKRLGVERGDRVIMQMPNTPEVFQPSRLSGDRCHNGSHQFPVGQEVINYIYRTAALMLSSPSLSTWTRFMRPKAR
jgi:hypothetical protein